MKRIEVNFITHLRKDNFICLLFPTFGFLSDEDEWSIMFFWLFFDLQIGGKHKKNKD